MMSIQFLMAAALLCCFILNLWIGSEGNILKACVLSISHFILGYAFICTLLFGIDRFSFSRGLGIELFVIICLLVFVAFHRTQFVVRIPEIVDLAIPLLIVMLLLVFFINGNELFDMGQDEGVYQAEAMSLAAGNHSVLIEFDESQLLESEEDLDEFRVFAGSRGIQGFYLPYDRPDLKDLMVYPATDSVSGVFHGIHTFSAVLALWGIVFGFPAMLWGQMIILFCCVFLVYYALHN